MKKARTKCYIYTRVSTAMQVDGYSLDAQREKLRKYADYEDMVIAGEYSDEGFSGKNIQGRHEFQQMLRDVQDCKDGVSYVLVFKLSRFGRNAADVLNSLQLMQDFGVNLICVEDGIDSSKDSGNETFNALVEQIKALNREITEDTSLGSGFRIGHSYFCLGDPAACTTDWMRSVVEFDLLPTLAEYWFDAPDKLHRWEQNLRGVFNDD